MKVVYKYPLQVGVTTLLIDPGFKPLMVEVQGRSIYMWAEVDPDVTARFKVETYGTGQGIPEGMIHLGSCQQGAYVWHFYTRGRE